jgi:hypothetical protein
MIVLHSCLVLADPITCNLLANKFEGGFGWTLTSRLGDTLKLAESVYGKRDESWTILGVEFSSSGPPQLWYPGY